jgi:hypothetical protein
MKSESIIRLAAVIAALHVAVLSYAFGPRHIGYSFGACLSALVVWGVVFLWNEQKRRRAMIVGAVLGLIVQQVIYQVWKTEIPGFWWPLAQFAALQFLIAFGLGRAAPWRQRENTS